MQMEKKTSILQTHSMDICLFMYLIIKTDSFRAVMIRNVLKQRYLYPVEVYWRNASHVQLTFLLLKRSQKLDFYKNLLNSIESGQVWFEQAI